ncbi:translocation protein TolB [Halolamina pelagica]|uniref:Translocation protein TolB n=1 Tax=Halolamina pelagica TaxID=699431 RepID=A0A0P7I213_9EURY|nr:translocation protein TolB [Halolamina pelagica]
MTTGEIINRTRHPDAKHRWGGWDSDGERFAFASNRRDHTVFDIYVQDRDAVGNDAELVYEGDGWLSLSGWSPEDDRLLVHEAHSSFDHDVHVLDVSDGGISHVTPHEGRARYSSVEWGPDGESLYMVTDHDSDTLRLERLDLSAGEFSVVEDGGEWNVDGVTIDEESRRVAYSRNVDGYTDLTIGELVDADRIDAVESPEYPDGVVGGVSWGPDGDRYALTVTASSDNTNVHVGDVPTGESERWTDAATAGIPARRSSSPNWFTCRASTAGRSPASSRCRRTPRANCRSSSISTAARRASAAPRSAR